MQNDMDLLKKQLKENIQKLIDAGDLKEARALVEQYKNIAKDDVEAYSMDAVILIIENKIDEAEDVLREGLDIDENDFDLNYNLGFIYEQKQNFEKALWHYKKALDICSDKNISSDINELIKKIQSKHNISVRVDKKKIVFFDKGDDKFIWDIINELSEEYETKHIRVTNYKQIDEGMQWADICWFEWCDELVAYGSKLPIAKEKKIICRLHSYEAFTDLPSNVAWDKVDKLIFVAEHIKNFAVKKFKIDKEKTAVIPNGVDINKWTFTERKSGFNIAYVGYINYKKGPMLLLHTFKAIYDKDHRYKLHIAGHFQDDRDVLYYQQMIKELGLENNVIYQGWQDNLDEWLEDKNYILCTSVLESQNMSVMQAMAKGIKPLVHNFVGAKTIYPKDYVWNTIGEAVEVVSENKFNSKEYRKFIEGRYSLKKQMMSIKKLVNEIYKVKENITENFDYKIYWNNRLNSKFDIEGVGYIGLGIIYNKFLYNTRFDILNYIMEKLYTNIKTKDVLELGPGIGMFTDYFYKKKPNNYYAIDISKRSQAELSKKYKRFKFVLGDISEAENFPNHKYDVIFAADVLLHLTDEEKYKNVIKNLSGVLKDKGYIITFDPITVIRSKSASPHFAIRDIKYVETILKENDLEVAGMLPSAFFMNYPFDKDILKDKAGIAQNTFDLIQSVFGSLEISDNTKEDLVEWISSLDKQCLINNEFGLSQKVLIIKKRSNDKTLDFSINDVWNYNDIKLQAINKEIILNKNSQINKYNLVELFKNNINNLIGSTDNNSILENH